MSAMENRPTRIDDDKAAVRRITRAASAAGCSLPAPFRTPGSAANGDSKRVLENSDTNALALVS